MVNHYALPPSQGGGTRHFALAAALTSHGHDVTILASNVSHVTREEFRAVGKRGRHVETIGGVRFCWLPTTTYSANGARRVWGMLRFSLAAIGAPRRAGLPRPNVVLGSNPHLFAALAAERIARAHGVPFIFEIRDIWPATLVDVGGMSPHHPLVLLFRRIENHLNHSASRIAVVPPSGADYLAGRGVPRERVVWVPNGVDTDLYPTSAPLPTRDVFDVVYAGNHGIANDLATVVEAARILAERGSRVRFRLYGDGPTKPGLARRSAELGLTNIRFEAPVPKTQVPSVLADADAGLLILRDSTLFRFGVSPNKVFDYMAAARPIVFCARAPGNPVELSSSGPIVPPGDPAALATAVEQLSAMPRAEREEMGLRGRRYVFEQHSLRALAGRLEQAMVSAVAEAHDATTRRRP
jgi:glycosyltransferase involved in cell wall biosynthesis